MAKQFMYGDCHLLAVALHELTGWPVYALHKKPSSSAGQWFGDVPSGSLHAFVVDPRSMVLDIQGVCYPQDIIERFAAYGAVGMVQVTDFDEFKSWGCYEDPCITDENQQQAMEVAVELLNWYRR